MFGKWKKEREEQERALMMERLQKSWEAEVHNRYNQITQYATAIGGTRISDRTDRHRIDIEAHGIVHPDGLIFLRDLWNDGIFTRRDRDVISTYCLQLEWFPKKERTQEIMIDYNAIDSQLFIRNMFYNNQYLTLVQDVCPAAYPGGKVFGCQHTVKGVEYDHNWRIDVADDQEALMCLHKYTSYIAENTVYEPSSTRFMLYVPSPP